MAWLYGPKVAGCGLSREVPFPLCPGKKGWSEILVRGCQKYGVGWSEVGQDKELVGQRLVRIKSWLVRGWSELKKVGQRLVRNMELVSQKVVSQKYRVGWSDQKYRVGWSELKKLVRGWSEIWS